MLLPFNPTRKLTRTSRSAPPGGLAYGGRKDPGAPSVEYSLFPKATRSKLPRLLPGEQIQISSGGRPQALE